MTPDEFLDLYEGWKWREKRRIEELNTLQDMEWRRFSALAAWTTAPHLKKARKPEDFYNPDKANKEKKTTTPEQTQKEIAELRKRMGV